MAKGRVYQLVDADGCRVIHVPVSAWPALTGIVTDNEYQFDPDCYSVLIQEVINMACQCLPVSLSYDNFMTWSSVGKKTLEILHCPASESQRIRHFGFTQESTGVAHVQVYAVKGTDVCTIAFKGNIQNQIPQTAEIDVWMVEADFIRLEVTVTASSGTFYFEAWGERWMS